MFIILPLCVGQLIREDNQFLNVTYVYEYDNAGNITAVKRCNFTTGSSPTVLETETYTYSASGWGDLLTAYNGAQITYDAVGNPLTYNNGTAYSEKTSSFLNTSYNNENQINTPRLRFRCLGAVLYFDFNSRLFCLTVFT